MAEKACSIGQFKKARSTAKSKITRKINGIKGLMKSQDNLAIVKDQLGELHHDLKTFKNVHQAYHSQLVSEAELRESDDYRVSVENIVRDFEHETGVWLAQIAQAIEKSFKRQSDSEIVNVEPQDSISQVGSRASYRTRSTCGSATSITSARAKSVAKRAALQVEVEILERLQQIEIEELVLQQRKKQLQLRGEIAAAEAEGEVYKRVESEARSYLSSSSVRVKPAEQHEADERSSKTRVIPEESTPQLKGRPTVTSNSTPVYANNALNSFHEESFRKLVEVQDNQNNALQQLIRQQQQGVMALTLPQPSMKTFSGNPIDYCDFIQSFEHLIESKTSSPRARLYYLIQHTSGSVQELMRSCLSMREDDGYEEARKLLKERFGQNYRVAAAHVQRITEGSPIKNEDGEALQQFSVQLSSCTNTLEKIGYLDKLNNSDILKKIIDRLPYAIRMKWRDVVDRIIEREDRDVTVKDINDFVTAKARATTHPIFGKISSPENKGKQHNTKIEKRYKNASGFANQTSSKALECALCSSNHWLSRCDKFKRQSLEERQRFVKEKKLCNNCLTTGHYVRSCPKESYCKVQGCSGKHSTFLHPKQENPTKSDGEQKEKDEKNPNAKDGTTMANNGYVKSAPNNNNTVTGLAVVPVRVSVAGSYNKVETYAFLDSGSNTTFCTDSLLKRLGAKGKKAKLALTTMQGENAPIECSLVSLDVSDLEGKADIKLPMVYSRPSLPVPFEAIGKQEDVDRWPHLNTVKIASINQDVGLLIGNDVPSALQPLEVIASKNEGPFATRTALGWTLNGPLGRESTRIPIANFIQADCKLEKQFERFCNLEFNDYQYDPNPTMSRNDLKAMEIMEETARLENGHYEMALPWKTYPPNLPNNRVQAESRLQLLKKRLQRNPNLHAKYKEFMANLLTNKHASKVSDQNSSSQGMNWYLPHHPVFHPQKPDKVRVVFDCSARYGNTSLNDQLLQGPDLTNSLVGVLTRFRQEPVAFISDIEAMFYQVRVRPSDRNALRFLWWPNGDLDESPEEYRMNVHLFGGASSPSCANYALKKTATDNAEHFNENAVETVRRNFYVDDCLKSVGEENEAVKLAKDLRDMLARGGFKLTKWISNSKKVLESIPESERAAKVKNLDFDQTPIERALGVRWNVSSDTFGFSVVIKDRPATRRGILSTVSSIYDPLGFAAPCILSAKLILQELCRLKLDWDDKIPDDNLKLWQAWLNNLPQLENLAVERCFKPATMSEIKSTQLHHFSDASQQGYGAVSYIRIEDVSGKVKSSFVMGKSRLAPMKPVTIPRLELSAAVVSTKLDKMSRNEISLPIDQSFFWTDSTCVLRYIENTTKRFQTFVANRIATIHDASTPKQWNYVDTHSNPADDTSRGVPADSLQRWIEGPDFLCKPPEFWPQRPAELISSVPDNDPEIKKTSVACVSNSSSLKQTQDPYMELFERFSSWSRLKRVFAWTLRFTTNVRHRKPDRVTDNPISPLSLNELANAETRILKCVQASCFADEFRRLQRCSTSKETSNESISKLSALVKLDPTIEDGVIRVGGRLQRAPIDCDARHQIILPKNHHVVDLLIKFYHYVSGHSGLEYTLSLIRQKFWIIRARSSVKKILSGCVSCRKRQASAVEQKMASLPKDRVTPAKPPFSFTGVDCFGPFEIRRGRGTAKRYGIIFTCLTLRAVHIEVASSLDTESFINALRRFIARRGQPEEMRSDNGGNFVKGERELREEVKKWNQSHIHDFLVQRSIKWTFNPPAGSHHGGVWERCIRTVRKVMRSITKEQTLDEEGLNTLMCEVESIVNGRPLTKLSDDPRDLEPLTPNHLLLLRSGMKVPPGVFSKEDSYGNRRWRQVQHLANVFWRRWIREYLPSLQERQKWHKQRRNLAVNDIVLILDEKTPRCSWPLGRILEVHKNRKDGLVRSVKVKTSTSVFVRPVDKIIFLESEEENDK